MIDINFELIIFEDNSLDSSTRTVESVGRLTASLYIAIRLDEVANVSMFSDGIRSKAVITVAIRWDLWHPNEPIQISVPIIPLSQDWAVTLRNGEV